MSVQQAAENGAHGRELPRITLVTGNAGKLREIQQILAGAVAVDAHKLDLPELQAHSAEEITREKAKTAFAALQRPVVIEDTSLGFDALGGLPGPYIKWFMERVGGAGLVQMLAGFESKAAVAQCTFALCAGPRDEDVVLFVGKCKGTVVAPRGTGGFGWDPIFVPAADGDGAANRLTFAEMGAEAKNKISHRARALAALRNHFAPPKGAPEDSPRAAKSCHTEGAAPANS